MTVYEPWNAERAAAIVEERGGQEGAALMCLQALQAAFGYVPEAALPMVAHRLNISRAEIHGIASFYHDLRDAPPGRHVLKLCRAEACQSLGAVKLGEAVRARLGVEWGGTTSDGAVTLEPVYCLGLCACAPAALLDNAPLGALDEGRLAALLDGLEAR
jgi:formate dehydrogenase subunit gamma